MPLSGNPYAPLTTPQQQNQQLSIVPVPNGQPNGGKYRSLFYCFGITEIIIGVISCIMCVIAVVLALSYNQGDHYTYPPFTITFAAPGIWCSIFVIVSGTLGVCLKHSDRRSLLNANLVMSIIACVMMGILLVMTAISAANLFDFRGVWGVAALNAFTAVAAAAALIICILHSVFCCARSVCKKTNYQSPGMLYHPQQPQYIQMANGQFMVLQNQPVMPQSYPVTSMPTSGIPITIIQPPTVPQPGSSIPVQPQTNAMQLNKHQDGENAHNQMNQALV